MKTGKRGIELIKEFEGFSRNPYLCPAGVWTIGYGSTKGVKKNTKPITKQDAEKLLINDLTDAERAVRSFVKVPLTQNQFDALVSFTFNLGAGALSRSTLLKMLNAGDYDLESQFLRWVRAGGKILPGLARRRQAEADLFNLKE